MCGDVGQFSGFRFDVLLRVSYCDSAIGSENTDAVAEAQGLSVNQSNLLQVNFNFSTLFVSDNFGIGLVPLDMSMFDFGGADIPPNTFEANSIISLRSGPRLQLGVSGLADKRGTISLFVDYLIPWVTTARANDQVKGIGWKQSIRAGLQMSVGLFSAMVSAEFPFGDARNSVVDIDWMLHISSGVRAPW